MARAQAMYRSRGFLGIIRAIYRLVIATWAFAPSTILKFWHFLLISEVLRTQCGLQTTEERHERKLALREGRPFLSFESLTTE